MVIQLYSGVSFPYQNMIIQDIMCINIFDSFELISLNFIFLCEFNIIAKLTIAFKNTVKCLGLMTVTKVNQFKAVVFSPRIRLQTKDFKTFP